MTIKKRKIDRNQKNSSLINIFSITYGFFVVADPADVADGGVPDTACCSVFHARPLPLSRSNDTASRVLTSYQFNCFLRPQLFFFSIKQPSSIKRTESTTTSFFSPFFLAISVRHRTASTSSEAVALSQRKQYARLPRSEICRNSSLSQYNDDTGSNQLSSSQDIERALPSNFCFLFFFSLYRPSLRCTG